MLRILHFGLLLHWLLFLLLSRLLNPFKMNEKSYLKPIEKFSKKLPHFHDGRINYSSSKTAPVINVVVEYKDKILLLKRSDKVNSYKGKWNTIGGYLDEIVPLKKKVEEELREELGITDLEKAKISYGESYEFHDREIGRTWIIFPVLVEFQTKPKIKIDWEHTEFKWIKHGEIGKFDCVPKIEKIFKMLGLM